MLEQYLMVKWIASKLFFQHEPSNLWHLFQSQQFSPAQQQTEKAASDSDSENADSEERNLPETEPRKSVDSDALMSSETQLIIPGEVNILPLPALQ